MLYKNTSRRRFVFVFVFRFFFDYLSGLVFLLSGKRGDALAMVRARLAFWKMQPAFRLQRMENRALTTVNPIPEVYRGSILFQYYFSGKRAFSAIDWK
jgi:hypothetical protein